ncbi:hypothetical protein WA026_002986 [Henosepilachna vigintioctopunctata]|uniref:CHK kinase-like domain-containing protein n=1 Tax=Henosepilachna vigintioctopunctata TaxID=420089 RepID=A0AAW1TL58_9CUCU
MSRAILIEGACNIQLLGTYLTRYWNRRVTVTSATVERACAKGSNFASDPWRVAFQYKEENKDELHNSSVIVKTRLTDVQSDAAVHGETAFKNEIYSYEKIIPVLNEFLESLLRVPGYVHGDLNAIVLEDMCARSFYHITKKIATNWNQIWSPIQEMAKLHAASIVMETDDKPRFQRLVKGITKVPYEDTVELGKKQVKSLELIVEILGETKIADGTRHKKIIEMMMRDDLWKRQRDLLDEQVEFRVINHGAIWINNYMYRNEMITLLDWQDIKYTSPAIDVGYFLLSNLDIDFLFKNKKDLLQFYLMHLHQYIYNARADKWTVEKLESMLDKLSYKWIENELKRCLLHSYMMALWITPVYSWSEAAYAKMEEVGGIETMEVAERMKHMTPHQKDRMIKLTQFFMEERNVEGDE